MKILFLALAFGVLGGCAGSFSCTFETDEEFMESIIKEINYRRMSDETQTVE